ncbi:MAG: sulfotransferase [Nocardioidaceae bacterium]|nr:sulfotransferase [Nocardioidaceae bacterium]NUS51360.1 sulfotransferase [Nocardioidaceae bacterium]
MTSPNPYVFVVGCPRSGTTLLQRMLDHHPDLAVANDSHFIPRVVADLAEDDPVLTPELVERVRGYRRFYRLGLSDAEVDTAARTASTYTELVAGLYTAYGAQRGKSLAGEKTPDFVKYLPQLHRMFPATRSVHIIRDGRDTALSVLEWAHDGKGPSKLAMWDEEPVGVCALWWRRQVRAGRRDGADLGRDLYLEVRYEDLVDDPEQHLSHMCRFLNLPDEAERMAAFHVGMSRPKPGRSAKSAWLPATPGLRDWHAMPERDRALFETLAGDLLEEIGYERSVDTVPAEVAEVAERCSQWWETTQHRRPRVGSPA